MKAAPFRIIWPLLCLLAALAGCGPAEAPEEADTDWTPLQMARAVRDSQAEPAGMTALLPGDGVYEAYLAEGYGLAPEEVEDGAVLASGGASAREIAVLRLAEEADPEGAAKALRAYLEERLGAFTGYLPEEEALLADGQVAVKGRYLALLVCPDGAAALAAFEDCFTQPPPAELPGEEPSAAAPASTPEPAPEALPTPTPAPEASPAPSAAPEPVSTPAPAEPSPAPVHTPPPTPAPEPWRYDPARLLEAWAAGEWSSLAEEDRAILDICARVLSDVVPADGSDYDYDRELAVHDWMVAHGSYDSNTLSLLPDFQENPNNDNPYGFLVDGKGICLGYASTFQLFMDLLGIQCVTVEGTAHGGTSAHAWNQVCLDGAWYCVDVTWDDPTTTGAVSARTAHRYFNVTSQFLRDTDHQWDPAGVPEAEGTALAWRG